jgi:hypothetical protein
MGNQTFTTAQQWGFNPGLRSPYVQEWNLGVQRQLGGSSALEVRYVGNLALRSWLSYNLNEVNIFENGFLNEFKAAQNNLAIANGMTVAQLTATPSPKLTVSNFSNQGLPGQAALPIMAAAFGSTTGSNYTTGTYITNLQTGAAGSMANNITQNQAFICNMFGSSFAPCANLGVTTPNRGYPINFWQANPFATGRAVNFEDSSGHSNYHALQLDFRQRPIHGAQFDVNYSWAHGYALMAQNAIQGQGSAIYYTNRDFRLNYVPSTYDIRHTLHISGTYDVPFGKGRRFLSQNAVADKVLGGWTLGTITTFQTGTPVILNGGYLTMNQNDPGVLFQNGLTAQQVQSSIGVYHTGNPWTYFINPQYIAGNGTAVSNIAPDNIAGQYGYHPVFYGPHWFNIDLSLNKSVTFHERYKTTLQAECLNIMNHPTWGPVVSGTSSMNVQSSGFGQTTGGPTGPRVLELRLNVEF